MENSKEGQKDVEYKMQALSLVNWAQALALIGHQKSDWFISLPVWFSMVYTLFKYYGNSGNLDLRGEGGGNSLSV